MTTGERVWDRGLQPERTSLAWQRTALAILALGLAVPKLTWSAEGPWSLLASVVIVAGAIVVFAFAQRRYRHAHRILTSAAGRLHDGRLPLFVAVLAVLLALVALGGLVLF